MSVLFFGLCLAPRRRACIQANRWHKFCYEKIVMEKIPGSLFWTDLCLPTPTPSSGPARLWSGARLQESPKAPESGSESSEGCWRALVSIWPLLESPGEPDPHGCCPLSAQPGQAAQMNSGEAGAQTPRGGNRQAFCFGSTQLMSAEPRARAEVTNPCPRSDGFPWADGVVLGF